MIFWTTFGIFIFCVILESITSWIFIHGSRRKHTELWEHAGDPTLWGNGDLFNAWPLNKYLIQRQYREIDNEEAIAFADKMRLPFVLSYLSAVISIAVFFSFAFYGVLK